MKRLTILCLLGLLPRLQVAQNADPVLDSLKRPLPAHASARQQAERLESILSYTLDDQYDLPVYSRQLDSLFHCCILGKTGDAAFEHKIEGEIPMFQGVALLYKNPERAKALLESSLARFSAYGDSAGLAMAYMYLGSVASATGDSLAFAAVYPKAMALSNQVKDPYLLATVYNNLGVSCFDFGRFAESAALCFRILDLIDQHPKPAMLEGKAGVLTNIGAIYTRLGDNHNARLFAQKALAAAEARYQDPTEIRTQLAWTLVVDKEYQKALDIYETIPSAPNGQQSLNILAATTYAMALCYRKLGDVQKALPLARKGVELLPIESHASYGSAALLELANCEFEANLDELALKHALLAYQTFTKAKNNGGCVEAAELLLKIYQLKHNYAKALEYSELRYKYQQQIERQQSTRQLAFGEFTRDNAVITARREAEIQAQLTQQRNIRYLLFAGLAVLALLAFLLYNRYRFKKKTAEQLEAKNREVEVARARAEASEAFKSRFLANMSHEIRTPLHGIAGFTDLLLDTALSEKQRRWLSSIQHSTDRLGEVVNDILDLSKLEAGAVKLRQVPFSPARVAADVQEALALRAENKGIELRLDVAADVPPALLGDPTRLYQILMNLTGNAVKFTEQGEVRLAVDGGRQTVDGSTAHALTTLTFSIADTGIGIPPEKRTSIFDSFQQAGDDTTARFGGTGLGLTIARDLVRLHGSDIQVESTPGQGTVFSFALNLPLADAAGLESETARGGDLHFTQPLRILLADDNALNREIATAAIRKHFENAEIVEAATGREAVDLLASQPFDVILMDMQMPEMTGTEATRHIRQNLHNDIPVIALTASATPEEIETALHSGMNRHLGKPFKPHELARAVAETLGLEGADLPPTRTNLPGFQNQDGFDLRFLHDFCDGDKTQIRHFIEKFLEQCPLETEKLEIALRSKNYDALYRAAHSFRPQLEFVGLKAAATIAGSLELGARHELTWPELDVIMVQLRKILHSFGNTPVLNDPFVSAIEAIPLNPLKD